MHLGNTVCVKSSECLLQTHAHPQPQSVTRMPHTHTHTHTHSHTPTSSHTYENGKHHSIYNPWSWYWRPSSGSCVCVCVCLSGCKGRVHECVRVSVCEFVCVCLFAKHPTSDVILLYAITLQWRHVPMHDANRLSAALPPPPAHTVWHTHTHRALLPRLTSNAKHKESFLLIGQLLSEWYF